MVALWGGGMHGCCRGACVVALGGHAWLLPGGMRGCSGGVCGCSGWGGMRGCSGGCAWDMMRYRDMVNEQAVRILLECILFTPVCDSVNRGAVCMVAPGGGVHGCSGGGRRAWLLPGGGMCGCSGGACMVAPGGRGHAWLLRGHAWDTMRYGDTVNEWAVRILLECILVDFKYK